MARPFHYAREEYPVIVSLTISLLFILISLAGWWLRASLAPMFERITTIVSLCCSAASLKGVTDGLLPYSSIELSPVRASAPDVGCQ